jgi:hypothetical protein
MGTEDQCIIAGCLSALIECCAELAGDRLAELDRLRVGGDQTHHSIMRWPWQGAVSRHRQLLARLRVACREPCTAGLRLTEHFESMLR